MTITHQTLMDADGNPTAALIPWDEFQAIQKQLCEANSGEDDDFELSPEWREELNRRTADIDSGRAKLIPHEDVISRVNERLEGIRSKRDSQAQSA